MTKVCFHVLRQLSASLMIAALVFSVVGVVGAKNAQAQSKKGKKATKQICITFDELPVAVSFTDVDPVVVTDAILETLKKHEVKAAGFVVGSRIGTGYDLLGKWLNGGHRLGNLTYSHQDFHEMDAGTFLRDVVAGSDAIETMLSGFGQKKRYFRYPFLHYGNTVDKKRQAQNFMKEYGIKVAHATVVVEDYLYNMTVEKSGGQLDSADYDLLLSEYITHVLEELLRAESLSREILKKPCHQILQLRANQLNALVLDELLLALEEEGYKFVSLDEALKDKLFDAPEAYFGLRGAGYLDMLKLSNPDLLPAQ
jgi:peptidoglycan/xylan/chitin deacetylase (PgdA/CDA1 family)